jgi:UDP-glucose 4-epimerase
VGNYAIVGGAGFIGSHFVDELANRKNQILVIDNFCSGSEERVEDHLGKPYFELANINAEDTASLTDAFIKPGYCKSSLGAPNRLHSRYFID